mmetsp:Transcript_5220/g.11041  ORF Transcript_5220/g.11041 Transcript_5220/m.11041 type:complete len:141 (-) Transcript_5220:54-476(-)
MSGRKSWGCQADSPVSSKISSTVLSTNGSKSRTTSTCFGYKYRDLAISFAISSLDFGFVACIVSSSRGVSVLLSTGGIFVTLSRVADDSLEQIGDSREGLVKEKATHCAAHVARIAIHFSVDKEGMIGKLVGSGAPDLGT